MKKRILLILAAALMSLLCAVNAAAGQIDVAVVEVSGTQISVPIVLKENAGLMGFRFTVQYDGTVLSDPVALRGTLTQNGLFDDSVSVASSGSFDVIFAGTENAVGDGTIATLLFAVKKTDVAQTELTVRFSEADTFDAAYQPIVIPAATIPVKISESASSPHTAPYTREATAEDVVAAVENAMQQQEAKTPAEVDAPDAFVSQVNASLGAVTGAQGQYKSADEVEASYQKAVAESFVSAATAAADSAEIRQAIDDALAAAQAESIAQVPPEKQAAFVQAVEARLAQSAPDLPQISDKLAPAEAVKAIATLEQENRNNDAGGVEVPQAKEVPRTAWIIAACTAGVILIFGAGALVIKKNRKHKEEVSE